MIKFKYLLYVLIFMCIYLQTIAQNSQIKGKIIDEETASPIAGVTVRLKGTSIGTVTDINGVFLLKYPSTMDKIVIVISSVNFEDKELMFNAESNTTSLIKLRSSINALKELILVGYSRVDKKKLIGAVGRYIPDKIGGNDLSIDATLQGRIAGLLVSPSNGSPGASSAIIIRGLTSLNPSGNSPLIVIDGVPIYTQDRSLNNLSLADKPPPQTGFGVPSQSQSYSPSNDFERNPLSNLSVDDIESIEVLKDAYATSIYGSRGAAGVILITTKKGNENEQHLNFNVSTTLQTPFKLPQLLTGDQYASFYTAYYDTLYANSNKIGNFFWPPSDYFFRKRFNTNWLNEIIRIGQGYDASINLSGGNDKTTYFFSGTYNKTASYIKNNDLERYSFRLNVNSRINKNLKIGSNLTVSRTINNALNAQTAYRNALIKAPNLPIYDTIGNKYLWNSSFSANYTINSQSPSVNINPLADLYGVINTLTDTRILGNAFAEIKITNWLNYRFEFGIDWFNTRLYNRILDRPLVIGGSATEAITNNFKYVLNNLLNFNKKLGYHRISGVIGQTFESSIENNNQITATGFPSDNTLSLIAANNIKATNALQQQWSITSFLARIDYAFNEKYLLGLTNRIDGSSLFSSNNRYVNFPSLSVGWIISNENFLEKLRWLSELKIRSSLGTTGTPAGNGYYGTQGQYSFTNYRYVNSTIRAEIPANPNLKWQLTTNFDAGIDIGLNNNKLKISLDYYNRQTTNLLLNGLIPGFTGFSSIDQNIGELKNTGFEITINSMNIDNKKFKWLTVFTIAQNKNIITKLYQVDALISAKNSELANGRFWKEGGSATSFNLFNWAGINPQNGNPIWKSNDTTVEIPFQQLYAIGKIDANSFRQNLGDALPAVFGGLDNRFQYDNIELSIYFSYAFGNKIYNGAKATLYNFTSVEVPNLSPDVLNYWKKRGEITNIPGLINGSNTVITNFGYNITDYTVGTNISRFLEDASFIRLKNISLSYNFKSKLIKKMGLKGYFKVYIEASNLFIITQYTGIDPEVSAYGSNALQGGYDQGNLPSPKTYRLGVKIGF